MRYGVKCVTVEVLKVYRGTGRSAHVLKYGVKCPSVEVFSILRYGVKCLTVEVLKVY